MRSRSQESSYAPWPRAAKEVVASGSGKERPALRGLYHLVSHRDEGSGIPGIQRGQAHKAYDQQERERLNNAAVPRLVDRALLLPRG